MNARRPRAGGVVLFVACLLLAGATGRAQDTVNRVADDVGPSASRGASRDTIPARSAMAPALADTAAPSINTGRMWLLGGTMAAGNAAIMTYYFSTYYSAKETERTRWHTFNDWYNADMNLDKCGHMFGTQMYVNTLYHAFRWADMPETRAMIWSSAIAFAFNLEMENTDALYKKWGFSWFDIAANTVGAAWPNAQRLWTPLQSVNLKMSYWPSANMRRKWQTNPMADYDGYTYWIALTVHDVLPKSLKPYWPEWLGIAAGYGVSGTMTGERAYNNDASGHGAGTQDWYLALDYDLRKIRVDAPFLKFLLEMVNLIHLPAPAIRFGSGGTVWYGMRM